MKVTGTKTAIERVQVEVDVVDILRQMEDRFKAAVYPTLNIPQHFDIYGSIYINDNGYWECWDDCRGHGSGLYHIDRQATEEEKKTAEAIAVLKQVADKYWRA